MNNKGSSESAELNSYHGDVYQSLCAGLRGLVIAHQSPLAHQPAEGSLDDPAVRQNLESFGVIGAFYNLDRQFMAKPLDPLGEVFPGVATIHPEDAQPSEPAQDAAQQQLRAVAFSGAGRSNGHAEHQPQSIHQQVAFAAFDPLAGVKADTAAVTVGLHALTVQNGRCGPAALAVGFPDEDAQRIVEHGPLMVVTPFPEDMVNRFPMGKVDGQITPRAATLHQIQDGINNPPPIHGGSSTFGRFGEHRFEISPLGVSQVGVVNGDFHRLKSAAANENPKNSQSNQAFSAFIWHSRSRKTPAFLFQTGS